MQPRMSMVTLGVTDLSRSIAFYEEGLGLPRRGEDEGIAFFNLNGTWLGLYGREALAEDAGVDAAGSGFRGVAIAHNVHSEQEVDQVMQQAIDAGAGLVKKAQPTSWGGYGGYFSDPDGHLWEVAYNPFSWIGPSDDNNA
ncbi:MAG: VOC family protein [Phycisphaeraceae bacterium]|nr:VOC family protein [Phycisphaeraceae bacterium]